MPEEHNQILTDKLAQYFFVTEEDAINNLKYEHIPENRIFFVGNTMIDTLVAYSDKIEQAPVLERLNIKPHTYSLITLHRPNNVDTIIGLKNIIDLLKTLHHKYSDTIKHLVFPIHPRTEQNFKKHHLWDTLTTIPNLIICKPQSYLNFQKLIRYAQVVITDSGGVQEETTYLNIPCITLRPSTERPVTIWQGSNTLLPFDHQKICEHLEFLFTNSITHSPPPPLWDGKATERVLQILSNLL